MISSRFSLTGHAERHRFSLYSSMLNQIGSIKSCSYDQFFLKSVRTKPYTSTNCCKSFLYTTKYAQNWSVWLKCKKISRRCGKICKERCEKTVDNVESCGRDTGTECKRKRAKAKICPCSLALKKFQVSVEVSNMRQPSMRVSFSRINGCAVSCPHAVSYFNMR